jgi:hypothetical protein
MNRFPLMALLLFAPCVAFAQKTNPSNKAGNGRLVWEPPTWADLRATPKATVTKQMLTALRVSNLAVTLEDTKMEDVRTTLGGTIGHMGDAGESLYWLCFDGMDSSGRWVLWLESGEINGGRVGGFQWQRLDEDEMLDPRCRMLLDAKVELPIALGLGAAESKVLKTLGRPTARHGIRLFYEHEHEESFQGEPFTSMNEMAFLLRDTRVWAMEAWKTTTN